MTPKFTEYCKNEAKRQGITTYEIREMLNSRKTLVIANEYDEDTSLSYGVARGRLWVIVFNWQSGSVITIYPATEEERRFYGQENKSRIQ